MLKENELIMHESAGVCRLRGREKLDRHHGYYYVLCPLYDSSSTLYVPVDSDRIHLRPIMSREDAMALIEKLPEVEVLHFESLNDQKQRSSEILKSGDPLRLAQLAKTIYQSKSRRSRSSKITYTSDHNILRQVEKLLFGELAVALDIQRADVLDFIAAHISAAAEA